MVWLLTYSQYSGWTAIVLCTNVDTSSETFQYLKEVFKLESECRYNWLIDKI